MDDSVRDLSAAVIQLVQTPLPSVDELERAASLDDYDRLERLDQDLPDNLVNIKEHVARVLALVFEAWEHVKRAPLTPDSLRVWTVLARLLARHAFKVHACVRTILPTDLERFRSEVVIASWTAALSSGLLLPSLRANVEDPAERFNRSPLNMMLRVHENAFVRALLATQQRSIVVTNRSVQDLSVTEWHNTFQAAWPALVRYGWTPAAHALLDALLTRYALWVAYDPEDAEVEAETARVFDDWMLCRSPDNAPIPNERELAEGELPTDPRLKLAFLVHLEKTVFFARRHLDAAHAFVYHSQRRLVTQVTPMLRRKILHALRDFIREVARGVLKDNALESVRNLLLRRHLMPGEVDRTMYENGSYADFNNLETDGILWDSRRREHIRLQETILPLDLQEHIERWVNACMRDSFEFPFAEATFSADWERIAAARPDNERTAFLVIEQVMDQLLRRHGVNDARCSFTRFGYCDDAGLRPPGDAPPDSPEDACRAVFGATGCQAGTPIWVAIAHVYAVVVPVPQSKGDLERLYVTPFLADALAIWLRLCVTERALFPRNLLPNALLAVLDELQM